MKQKGQTIEVNAVQHSNDPLKDKEDALETTRKRVQVQRITELVLGAPHKKGKVFAVGSNSN